MPVSARAPFWRRLASRLSAFLPPHDLLRDARYRRMFSSILVGSFGTQMTMLALPLTAAVLLNATPTQMGILLAVEILPFALFSLPTGVVLDRIRKLPVYVGGEALLALAVASVPLAWWLGWLTMHWLYVVGFVVGCVNTVAGSAAQIVLTQIVPRHRLVEAHAKNGLANSVAEVAGPGAAGALIKLLTAPVALLFNAALLAISALILMGMRVAEGARHREPFWPALRAGLRFVAGHRLLVTMALAVGSWNVFAYAAQAVQILYATRLLKLSEGSVGLSFMMVGVGTVLASLLGPRIVRRIGSGPAMIAGFAVSGVGWLLLALVPVGPWGVVFFALMLACFGAGAILIFVNFLALRQAVTPTPLLGRMTSTMRWLILVPGGPGALIGGWLGDAVGLRAALAFAGVGTLLLAWIAWRTPLLRKTRELPVHRDESSDAVAAAPATPLVASPSNEARP